MKLAIRNIYILTSWMMEFVDVYEKDRCNMHVGTTEKEKAKKLGGVHNIIL